jgi:LmbE family N-acetylglucosaminyl deacetylase
VEFRILAIGAHPDDWEVGAAGLFQRATDRFVIVASNGGRGGHSETRIKEAHAAMKMIGASGVVFDHPDTCVAASNFASDIESVIRDFRPDTILTTSSHDAHQDHAAVSAATMIAVRDWSGTVLAYSTPSAAERFCPNWFIGLTEEEMKNKMAVVSCHASQMKRPYLASAYLEATGKYWSHVTRSSSPFVEPYELLRHREP